MHFDECVLRARTDSHTDAQMWGTAFGNCTGKDGLVVFQLISYLSDISRTVRFVLPGLWGRIHAFPENILHIFTMGLGTSQVGSVSLALKFYLVLGPSNRMFNYKTLNKRGYYLIHQEAGGAAVLGLAQEFFYFSKDLSSFCPVAP